MVYDLTKPNENLWNNLTYEEYAILWADEMNGHGAALPLAPNKSNLELVEFYNGLSVERRIEIWNKIREPDFNYRVANEKKD